MANVSGPAIGGFLYVFGPSVVFGIEGACLGIAAILAFLIGARPVVRLKEKVTLETLLAGLTFIRSRPVVLGAISLDMVAVILGGATALLPIFARDILEVGPVGLGLLRSAPAVGAVCVGLAIARFPLNKRVGQRMFQSVAAFGLATIAFGLSTNFYFSLFALFLVGASDMVSVVIRLTLVQIETPDEMRGRVAAVNAIFIGASNELGAFESGALAALAGPVFPSCSEERRRSGSSPSGTGSFPRSRSGTGLRKAASAGQLACGLPAEAHTLRALPSALQQELNAFRPVLGGVAVFRREDVDHRHRPSRVVADRGCQGGAAADQLTLALGIPALPDRVNLGD
jgi:MFS family permease